MDVKDYGLASDPNDGFLDVPHTWFWQVQLSDGQVVFQDDGRPGIEPASAWIRLGNCLKQHPDIGIVRFGVYFRNNSHFLPDEKAGYYFSKGLLQGVGALNGLDYYVMGWLEHPDEVIFHWIKVPELLLINQYSKPLVECSFPTMILGPAGLTVPPLEL